MKSWIRASGQRARVLVTALALAIPWAIIATPAAEAASYNWTGASPANQNWNNPDNWVRTDAAIPGFPNAAGDAANFGGGFATVAIPDGVTIRAGSIAIIGIAGVTINAGSGASIILDAGAGANAQVTVNSNVALTLNVPIQLQSDINVHTSPGGVEFMSGLSQIGGSRGVRKTGNGSMFLGHANTCTGATVIVEGAVRLASATGPSISGELTIGTGAGAVQSAQVRVEASDQIADTVRVTVNADGWLRMPSSDILGELVVNDGAVTLDLGTLTMRKLTMTGGVMFILTAGNFRLEGPFTATSSNLRPAQISRANMVGVLNLLDASRTFTVADGPNAVDLEIFVPVTGTGSAGVIKEGPGTMKFNGVGANTYPGTTVVHAGRLELARMNAVSVPGALLVEGAGGAVATVGLLADQNLPASAAVTVNANGLLSWGNHQGEIFGVNVGPGGRVDIGDGGGTGTLNTLNLSIAGGQIALTPDSHLNLGDKLIASSSATQPAVISGNGLIQFGVVEPIIETQNGPQPIDLRIDARIRGAGVSVGKTGPGVAQFTGANLYTGATRILDGTLLINGAQPQSSVTITSGVLGGNGTVGVITAGQGQVAPGMSPGRLSTGALSFSAVTTLAMELNGTTAGVGYDQLAVTGAVNLANATLALSIGSGFEPSKDAKFTIVSNDGSDPVVGTFAGLAEGAKITVNKRELSITYTGGDGNDIVLTAQDEPPPPAYFLSEGATGEFFDEDVAIANPHETTAPVKLTFLKDSGQKVEIERTLGPRSHTVVHVDEIPGMEAAVASVKIESLGGKSLFVERSMFWDKRSYAGHTGSAIDQPSQDWFFAEGAQGFFDTFVLIVNPNDTATDITLTFLLENESPVVKTMTVAAGSRETVYTGNYRELKSRSFGMTVHATKPIMAERSMYFGSLPGRQWGGGHESAGVTAPSKQWYLAEGATGFFDTFILLGNPQPTPAEVTVQFLLTTGETITVQKTVVANGRLTVNPAAENDPRLKKATFSTVVTSNVPIVAERSMYWETATAPWGEAHNSFGVVEPATEWGLAEGRLGGSRAPFSTYILLANPQTTDAQVEVAFLRDAGAPIVKTYTVPATGRFTIDASTIPDLRNSTFGAAIVVTNNVPIVVERSMYWNAEGIFWSGGTNATGIVATGSLVK